MRSSRCSSSPLAGKNCTDCALIIDAMDLLYAGNFDGFCRFQRQRLHAAGVPDQGIGAIGLRVRGGKTPVSFVKSCDRFISLNLRGAARAGVAERQTTTSRTPLPNLKQILSTAIRGTSKGRLVQPQRGRVVPGQESRRVRCAGLLGHAEARWLRARGAVRRRQRRAEPTGLGQLWVRLKPAAGRALTDLILPLAVVDQGMHLEFSFADLMRYHGPGSPGGVAHAYKVLERGLRMLAPDGVHKRREVVVRTAFAGPGARDAFELVLRGVTGERYTVDPALARPARGRAAERFVFVLGYREREVTLGVATDSSPTSSSTSRAPSGARPSRRPVSPRSRPRSPSGSWPRPLTLSTSPVTPRPQRRKSILSRTMPRLRLRVLSARRLATELSFPCARRISC